MFWNFPLNKIQSHEFGIMIEFYYSALSYHLISFELWFNQDNQKNGQNLKDHFIASISSVFFSLIQESENKMIAISTNISNPHIIMDIGPGDDEVLGYCQWYEEWRLWFLEYLNRKPKFIKKMMDGVSNDNQFGGVIYKFSCEADSQDNIWKLQFNLKENQNILYWFNLKDNLAVEWSVLIVLSYKDKNSLFIDYQLDTFEVLDIREIEDK